MLQVNVRENTIHVTFAMYTIRRIKVEIDLLRYWLAEAERLHQERQN
jgi:hypothetical protein